jgi:L-2-hydroxyglutarate oxidase
VLEAEDRVAEHQTGHNSGVIHAGLYYRPGSLKATLCAQGRESLYEFCERRGIPNDRCGKIVIATHEGEIPALEELERRGNANGLKHLRKLSPDELREHEPYVRGVAGLFVEETGIVDYQRVTAEYSAVVQEHGGEVRTGTKVLGIHQRPDGLTLETSRGDISCNWMINCGGLQCDRIARMAGLNPDVQIIPFRGEYYMLSEPASKLVRNLIYPVPNPEFPFLGVHFTRMIGGGVEAGPNAVLALARHGYSWGQINLRDCIETFRYPGFWTIGRKYWRTGFGEVVRSLSKKAFCTALQNLVSEVREHDLQPAGAGVRAQAVARNGTLLDDFCIQGTERSIHVLNAPSPAATASMAIGSYIADLASRSFALEE